MTTRFAIPQSFDDAARKLLREMLEAGWDGRMGSKGHAIMRAPDGVTTMAVVRSSKRSSGANQRAEFERWKKQRGEAGEAFGVRLEHIAPELPSWEDLADTGITSSATWHRLTRDEAFHEWIRQAAGNQEQDGLESVRKRLALLTDENEPRRYAIFDRATKPPTVITAAFCTPEQALDALRQDQPHLFPQPEVSSVTKFVCAECDLMFDKATALHGHRLSKHSGEQTCPDCGQVFGSTPALGTHRRSKHGYLGVAAARKAIRAAQEAAVRAVPEPAGSGEPEPAAAGVAVGAGDEPSSDEPSGGGFSSGGFGGGESVLAQVRALVAGELLAENTRLRALVDQLETENKRLRTQVEEFKAWASMLPEVPGA